MARNVRTYNHFCVLARALERVGDRWSLLVVRDLLAGPKRFTDLMDRLGGITPKTLTQRLRELEQWGVVAVERQAGRREVWYRLTPAGADLGPAVEALSWWGLQHAWRSPRPGEPLHVEHLLRAIGQVVSRATRDRKPTRWHFRFRDAGDYLLAIEGRRWSLTTTAPEAPPDVTVTGPAAAWSQFVGDPALHRAADLGLHLAGDGPALRRFERLLRAFPDRLAKGSGPPAG